MRLQTTIAAVAIGASILGALQIAVGVVGALAIVLVVGFAFDWVLHRGGDR